MMVMAGALLIVSLTLLFAAAAAIDFFVDDEACQPAEEMEITPEELRRVSLAARQAGARAAERIGGGA